jgi:hypothetical protein
MFPIKSFVESEEPVRRKSVTRFGLTLTTLPLEYWSGLASSANFPGRSLLECLKVIHLDIVNVWNFEDPNLV